MIARTPIVDDLVDRTGLATQIYERLLRRISEGFWPAGQRLNIDQLARDLQVSITPVREALARLSSQHLIQFEPYKGYSVLPAMDVTQVAHLFEARAVVEIGAVRAGVARFDHAQVQALRSIATEIYNLATKAPEIDYYAITSLDQAFHRTLVAAARNDFLSDMYELLIPLIHLGRLRYSRYHLAAVHEEVSREHAAIVDAYERRDADAAEGFVRWHLLRARERIEAQMAAPPAAASGQ
jgi:DNA-binding GntR family transcriptional regulator